MGGYDQNVYCSIIYIWHLEKSSVKSLYYLLHKELSEAKAPIYWFISSPSKNGTVKLKTVESTQIKSVIQFPGDKESSPIDSIVY